MRVGPFAFRYQANGATPCQYIDTTRKAIDCGTTLPLRVLNETLQHSFRPLLSKLSKRRQSYALCPHYAIIACNYFRIWAGLMLSISGCDVTSKMSADEKFLLLAAAASAATILW